MATLAEGNPRIDFPAGTPARKFDDISHGLAHCMKAVDFIVELDDRYLFIEIKDPQHPDSKTADRNKWIRKFLLGSIDEEFKYKYRDSFLYAWASDQLKKPIHYYVIVAIDTLSEADLIARTDDLKRKLPLAGPASGVWKRNIVDGCAVFNIATWNKILPDYPLSRIANATLRR
jgi:hypothetical protein